MGIELVGGASQLVSPGLPFLPLTVARTVFVNSATGNDNNPGTSALPYQTWARALAERNKYSDLQNLFKIQLQGAGPYTYTPIIGSICSGANGFFFVEGDTAAETTHTTGTFTGDFVLMVIGTSAGLGVNTQQKRWVRVTSGACNGAEFEIIENTDTSITAATKTFRTTLGAIVNGDTFKIFTPGTTISVPGFTTNQFFGMKGGGILAPRHIFHGLRFTTTGPSVQNSQVAFFTCKFEAGVSFLGSSEVCSTQAAALTVLGINAGILQSSGIVIQTQLNVQNAGTSFTGPVYNDSFTSVGTFAQFNPTGGRFEQDITVGSYGFCQISGTGSAAGGYIWNQFIDVQDGGRLNIVGSVGLARFSTTAGSCVRIRRNGECTWRSTANAFTGGTTDAAGFGVDVTGGGRCIFSGITPSVTGGTGGRDLKTTASPLGVANATLNAVGTTVDALGSPFAETLSRAA